MENSGFLKTVNFGGFDKKDVLAYVDSLNTKIYSLEAELQEAKANGGSGSNNAELDALLAKERAAASEFKAKVDTLNLTIQSNEEVIKSKDEEIAKLKAEIDELNDKLANAPKDNFEASAADISNVFIEAQKSANAVVAQARENAKKMEADSKALAEEVINDANTKAARIIYDAERESEGVKAIANQTKAQVKGDIDRLLENFNNLNATIANFTKESTTAIEAAKATIDDAQKNIAAGTFTSAVKSYSSVPKEAPAKEPPKKASVNLGDLGDLLNAVEAEAKKEG
jgi:cell division septum initiation protein DivIVA